MVEISIKITGNTVNTEKARELISLAQELCSLEMKEATKSSKRAKKDSSLDNHLKVEQAETIENSEDTQEIEQEETSTNEDTQGVEDTEIIENNEDVEKVKAEAKIVFRKCIRSSAEAKAKAKELLNSLGVERFTELEDKFNTKISWKLLIEDLQKLM